MSLFENVTEKQEVPAILLIDASGSTLTEYHEGLKIIEKIRDIVKNIPNDNFRIIFWNSDTNTDTNEFPGGVFKLPHVVSKKTINQPFLIAKNKITKYCLTFPHLGFNKITPEWINNKKATHIYYITDGQITTQYGNDGVVNKLQQSIENLFKSYNNIHLHLYTVEKTITNFNESETLDTMAGGDVYNIFRKNNLTKYITEFVSFTPNNNDGYKHIDTIIPPSGFIPYEQKFFSELKTYLFIDYIRNEINGIINLNDDETKNDKEDLLLKIIQNLTTTIKYLTKDKAEHVKNTIIKTFCNLFQKTVIDKTLIEFMLIDSTARENNSFVFSEYRANLKNLYKQADTMLLQNVSNAIGISGSFICLPIDNKIITGSSNYIEKNIKLNKRTYNKSSIEINDVVIPVIPFATSNLSFINKQCIRQYVRTIIGAQYKVDTMGDIVIHIVLGLMLQVFISNLNDSVKNSYKDLAKIMLEKKRYGKDITEFDNIKEGNLPLPNMGNMDGLFRSLEKVKSILNLKCENLTLWYAICLALGDEEIINKQYIHCCDSITKDYPNINGKNLLEEINKNIEKISIYELPNKYNYNCPITMENTSNTGGMLINDHDECCSKTVISKEGYEGMFELEIVMCPFCYKLLNRDNFEEVQAKITNNDNKILDNLSDPFKFNENKTETVFNKTVYKTCHEQQRNTNSKINDNVIILLMRGVVGCGKTTFSTKLGEKLTENGIKYIIQGTDMYCKQGMTMSNAVNEVKNNLSNVNGNEKNVVIIDTCGENINYNSIFGCNFNSAKKLTHFPNFNKDKKNEYLSWALYNLLSRGHFSAESNFWLTPNSVGNSKCIEILNKKSKNIWGNKIKKFDLNTTKDSLKNDYDNYQKYLDENMSLDDQVDKMLKTIIG